MNAEQDKSGYLYELQIVFLVIDIRNYFLTLFNLATCKKLQFLSF